MGNPIDGQGVYESVSPRDPSYDARLQQIAAGGFQLVMNYSILYGHASDLLNYASLCHAHGLRLIWALHAPLLWDGSSKWHTEYAALARDSTATTQKQFVAYIVNLVRKHPATYGYYVADEVSNGYHPQLKAHVDLIHSIDRNHPRIIVLSASGGQSFGNQNTLLYDCCEIGGDNFYWNGCATCDIKQTGFYATNVRDFDHRHGIQPIVVLQSFWAGAYNPNITSTWPTREEMRYQRDAVLATMTPRFLLWYSFFDIMKSPDSASHWSDLVWAANGPANEIDTPDAQSTSG